MTDTYWVRDLFDAQWDTSGDPITPGNRIRNDLPSTEPKFEIEGSPEKRARQVDTQPVIYFTNGGTPQLEPKSIGYRDEGVENEVVIQFQYKGTKREFKGEVDNDYGGIVGEGKRILDEHRKGFTGAVLNNQQLNDPGYDIITYDSIRDQSDMYGGGIWVAEMTARFKTFARSIEQ